MALKTKLSKADYEALSDHLKTEYIPDGEGYKLDADYEDVTGLLAKRDELLKEQIKLKDAMKAFEGLDAEAAKAALAKVNEIEDGQLVKKQQFDELFTKKKGEWDTEKTALETKINAMTSRAAQQQLAVKLGANGIKPTMAEDLAEIIISKHLNYVEDGGEINWKTKDGLETVDLDKYIPSLKESKADYFASTMGGGSGASGSEGKGGSAKTMPHAQWKELTPQAQAAFIKEGGKPVD